MNKESIQKWADEYLISRGVGLGVAAKYNVRLTTDADELNKLLGRKDGARIEAGIIIGNQVRLYRKPLIEDEDRPLSASDWATPGNEPWQQGDGVLAKNKFQGEDPGIHQWDRGELGVQLVRVTGKSNWGGVYRERYYPIETPRHVDSIKFLSKAGDSVGLYMPEPVVGGRPLLIVEGYTRVLAVLSNLGGRVLDVVGLRGCRVSEDDVEQLKVMAKAATTVTVVLDGDVITNDEVADALNRLCGKLEDKDVPNKIRVGIPEGDKVGLDDWLAANKGKLNIFLDDCLPWNPTEALKVLKQYGDKGSLHPARTKNIAAGVLVAAEHKGLAEYEETRQALSCLGYEGRPHPRPEGSLWAPSSEDIATVAAEYILPKIGQRRVGASTWCKVSESGICTVVAHADYKAAVHTRLQALMARVPTQRQGGEAFHQVEMSAGVESVKPVRVAGETCLAFAEVPLPKALPTPAWDEFLGRLTDPKVFLAWVHTLTIDGWTGRQALYLKGDGHDGKSQVSNVLMRLLGSAATIVDKATGEEQFGWSTIYPWTRLVVLDDIKNTNIIHAKKVRQLCAGGYFEVERKYEAKEIITDLRTRVMICSNEQLKYSGRAEQTRVLQVDVRPGPDHADATWPRKLTAELAGLLYKAREAFNELRVGDTIVPTESSAAVAEQGADAVEGDFDALLLQLEFGEGRKITAGDLQTLAAACGVKNNYGYRDFAKLLQERGCKSERTGSGTQRTRVWCGVGKKRIGAGRG